MTGQSSKNQPDISRRRYLARVLVVFFGASYAVLEIVDIFIDQLGLPDWFFPGVIVLLLIGLPIVVATALVQSRNRIAGAGEVEMIPQPAAVGATADPGVEADFAVQPAARSTPWLTWRKAIVGFVAAFALWGVVVAGYMAMRALGIGPVGSLVAAGVIEERERIILADFESNTDDPLLGRATTEAFRTDLSQSTVVTVVSGASVERVLALMQKESAPPLDEDLAREVAIREGIKAVVAGDITPVGGGYVLTARLVSAQDGQVLAAARESARDSTAIIPAIDQLSKKLRERIGESLKTIRRSEPLDQVTTSSLEALRTYSQAVRLIEEGEHERAIPLLEQAVGRDPAFAMAWRKLGVTLGNVGRDRARQIEALTQAYEHRDRLVDRERYMTEGSYYQGVIRDSDRAAAAYQALLDLYPNDTWAMNNLALTYMWDRDFRRANQLYERAIELDSAGALYYEGAIITQIALGDFGGADETHRRITEKFPEHPTALLAGSAIATARFDYDLAEEQLRAARESASPNRLTRVALGFSEVQIAEIRGQLGEAERMLEGMALIFEQQGDYGRYFGTTIRIAFYDLLLRAQADRAVERVEAALARRPLEEFDPLERPYEMLAVFYALAGRDEQSRDMLAAAKAVDDQASYDKSTEDDVARAILSINEGRTEEAIRQIRLADVGECSVCALPVLGRIYDAAGETDSVVAVYERYLETPWLYRLASTDWWALAGVYERLGGLYELNGDTDKALHYYNRFAELWKDADPELQPRVDAARRAIERLSAEEQVSGKR